MSAKGIKKYYMIVAVAAIVFSLSLLYIISKKDDSSNIIQEENLDIKFNKQGSLDFMSANGSSLLTTIDIEVADNTQLRARGLMYRKSIPNNAGMLFTFDFEDYQGFWMKNTYIALDILFVNSNKEIVTLHANTIPMSKNNYESTEPAMYVVEVNAGYCMENNIKVGDLISFKIDN